jgi:histone acetyltransferase (RNA polymerase elongator complex component)
MATLVFRHPEPRPLHGAILPAFIPFSGCPHRCVFCAQPLQTGEPVRPLAETMDTLRRELQAAHEQGRSGLELAFYGGTFTALPDGWDEALLKLAGEYRKTGLLTRVRCSTRPDAVAPHKLRRLRELGLDGVELGVQSFEDGILAGSGRGYTAETARQGCHNVRKSGLWLGVQLMPGLANMTATAFERDVETTCEIRPDAARLYPCLVLAGTPLVGLWREGRFRPWDLESTTWALSRAMLRLWNHDIPTIRTGLAAEPGLAENVLDGPWHPALGHRARSLALYTLVRSHAALLSGLARRLTAPRRHQGELWGHRGELRPLYARLGLAPANVRYHDAEVFILQG